MTKPNFVSSHDWHVQLCCQRSWLHPPKRAALDQGRNRQSQICVLELDALFSSIFAARFGILFCFPLTQLQSLQVPFGNA